MRDDIHISADGLHDSVTEALQDPVEIDPAHPGFQSLLLVLDAGLDDAVDMSVMVAYHNELADRLDAAWEALDATPLPSEFHQEAWAAMAAARQALEELNEVVALLGDYLGSGNRKHLTRARKVLVKVLGDVTPQ